MVSKVNSVGLWGLDGYSVEVETDSRSAQEPSIDIVGLPDAAIKEARDRIYSAIHNAGYRLPSARIILNLAPADIKKEGTFFDLPMILGILSSTGQISEISSSSVFVGELSLSGELRRGSGMLAMIISARSLGFREIYIPEENVAEGSVIEGIDVYGVRDVRSLIEHLEGRTPLFPTKRALSELFDMSAPNVNDFAYVVGQQSAKRACEIAAAGGHNMLFIGPPGTGKSMLAGSLPGIMPDMTFEEIIDVSKIYSIAGMLSDDSPLCVRRPFIKSNQNVSVAALTGGGASPRPGLISLAHNGVLFLDEIAEFSTRVLETLRQPLEDNCVTVNRVKRSISYPSAFMLVCAMNPCPCGYFGHPTTRCTCTPQQIERYLGKISGPLLDRIDLQVSLPPVPVSEIKSVQKVAAECSADIKKRVNKARKIQQERFRGQPFSCNAKMSPKVIKECCVLTEGASSLLNRIFEKSSLSMRSYDKIIKISRTLADLSGSEKILPEHISEAAYFRSFDKNYKH